VHQSPDPHAGPGLTLSGAERLIGSSARR